MFVPVLRAELLTDSTLPPKEKNQNAEDRRLKKRNTSLFH